MALEHKIQAWLEHYYDVLEQGYRDWRARWKERHARWLRLFEKLKNPSQASYELAKELAAQGLFNEAKYRYKFTLWRQPGRAAAWYNLACCHLALDEEADAIAALKRCLQLKPRDEAARYLLAQLADGVYVEEFPPHTTPPAHIAAEFDEIADIYETQELERGYRGHWEMFETYLKCCGKEPKTPRLLDAGCGTGLLGPLIRPYCEELIGLDISEAMLDEAENATAADETPCYDALIHAELVTHLQNNPQHYDVMMAANVVPILGELQPFLQAAFQAVKPGGWLLFSAEQLAVEQARYQFDGERKRFVHSAEYLHQQAQRTGWLPNSLQSAPLYAKTRGWVAALQKPEA